MRWHAPESMKMTSPPLFSGEYLERWRPQGARQFHTTKLHRTVFRKSSRLLAYRVGLALEAANWNSEIRELLLIMDTLRNLRGIEIIDQSCSRIWFKARVDQRDGNSSYGTDLDRDRVVEDSPSIRKASQVASQYSENVRICRWGDGHVQPQQVRRSFAREILESGNNPRWYAGEQNGLQVRARFGVGSQVGEHSWIEDRKQACHLGVCVLLDKLAVIDGTCRVPEVLLAHRDDHFINQWLSQP